MKKKIVFLFCLMGLAAGIFTGCQTKSQETAAETKVIKVPDKITWKEKKCVLETLGYSQKTAQCMYTAFEGIEFDFAKESFNRKNATKFAKAAIELISYGDAVFGKEEHNEKVFFNTSGGESLEVGKEVDFDVLWKVVEKAHKMCGAEQYGLFYLYSVKHGLVKANADAEKKVKDYFGKEENLYLLDFCLPVTETKFFDDTQATMSCEAVKSFAAWYEKEYSYEAYETLCRELRDCDKEKLVKEKNAWLKSIGCNKEYKELGKLYFSPTKKACSYSTYGNGNDQSETSEIHGDYEIECSDAVWVFTEAAVKKIGYKETVKQFLKIEPLREKDYEQARNFMKDYLPENLEKVIIYTNFDDSRSYRAGEFNGTNGIILFMNWEQTASSLLHEYCHFLTMGRERILTSNAGIFQEWLAEWLAVYQLKNEEAESVKYLRVEDYEALSGGKTLKNAETCTIADITYWKFLATKNDNIDSYKDYSYTERATLCKYIYETYGMEKLIELVNSNAEFEKILGKTVEEIYAEAKEFVRVQLSDEE